jgi:hypothetical protein
LEHKLSILFLGLFLIILFHHSRAIPQTDENARAHPTPEKPALVQAEMCQEIEGYSPLNPAIVFSIEIGKVSCFTSFDPVSEEMYIYQKWYHKDKLSTQKKLLLKPPRWSTFSSIQLREADKGPWRVEITDHEGGIIRVLRFSITD